MQPRRFFSLRSVHALPASVVLGGALVAIACNVINGADELAVCEGAACAALEDGGGGGSSGTTTSSSGTSGGEVDSSILTEDGGLPPGPCVSGTKVCTGRSLQTCVDTNWQASLCVEACVTVPTPPGALQDAKCDAWPSCRNAAGVTCGATLTSCCESKSVPGGTFKRRGSTTYPATISPFSLDLYEVTVGRFRAFVDANKSGTKAFPPAPGVGAHPKIAGSGWQATWNQFLPNDMGALKGLLGGGTWTDAAGANELKPINTVPWLVAFSFCAWDGGRLPTFAEANFAAAGGDEQRIYPWSVPSTSTTISPSNATYNCEYAAPPYTCPGPHCSVGGANPCDPTACAALGGSCIPTACYGCDTPKDIANVGVLDAGGGRYGHFDLAGNVAELLLDAPPKQNDGALPTSCTDCAPIMGPDPTNSQPGASDDYDVLFTGGHWSSTSTNDLRTTAPVGHWRWSERANTVGFRCARD